VIEQRTGVRPNMYQVEDGDAETYDLIQRGETIGMFQIETSLCRSYCARHQPRSIEELSDLTTYVRPGPRNSGAAEAYLRRRASQEDVTYPHPLLEGPLGRSYGLLLYQEDILAACRLIAGYDDLEADGVRKILGKKLTDKIKAAGEEFVRRSVERGHDREQVSALWDTMAEFGKYAFNRAHAYSYATLTFWLAWLKVNYPVEALTAILSTLGDMDRMAEFTTEARRVGITVLSPDVRFCRGGFTSEGLSIRYGLSAIHGVGPAAITKITARQPYSSYADFQQRSGVDAGVLYALARAGALDALVPSRRGLVRMIEASRDGSAVRCLNKDPSAEGPNGLPCTYDWENEPQPPPRISPATGKALKVYVKPPPKKCTVACRRYSPPKSLDLSQVAEYSPGELFRMETDTYGCWMSDAAFAQLEQLGEGMRAQSRMMALMLNAAPEGTYPMAAIYAGARSARTKAGNTMWWATLVTEVSSIDVAVFSPRNDNEPDLPYTLRKLVQCGSLVSAELVKRSYETPGRGRRMGWRLADIWPLGGPLADGARLVGSDG